MTWTAPGATPVDGPLTGPERPILEGYLDWQRASLLDVCAGLTAEQLAEAAVPPSNLTLLGLVRHMAKVERIWFRERVRGETLDPMYDPALGRDADFEAGTAATAEADHARLVEEVRLAREAVADVPLDATFVLRGETHSLRLVYVHMTAEYARHNGHADLLRQRIDGVTGR
jgi:uncharacterized damage-inducible protein DinB